MKTRAEGTTVKAISPPTLFDVIRFTAVPRSVSRHPHHSETENNEPLNSQNRSIIPCNNLNKSRYKNCNFKNRWRKIIIHLPFIVQIDRSYHEAFRFITRRGDLYHCSQEQRGFPVISLTVVGIYRQNRVKIPLPSKEDLRPSPFLFFLSSENLSVPNKPARNPRVGARAESISFEEFFLAVNN